MYGRTAVCPHRIGIFNNFMIDPETILKQVQQRIQDDRKTDCLSIPKLRNRMKKMKFMN